MAPPWTRHALSAHVTLPIGFAALLVIGGVAAGTGGQIPALGVLVAVAVVVASICLAAEPLVAPALGLIGWLTVVGTLSSSHAPGKGMRGTSAPGWTSARGRRLNPPNHLAGVARAWSRAGVCGFTGRRW